jgi:hypothetical protein
VFFLHKENHQLKCENDEQKKIIFNLEEELLKKDAEFQILGERIKYLEKIESNYNSMYLKIFKFNWPFPFVL